MAAGRAAECAIEAFAATGLAATFLAGVCPLLTAGAFGTLCLVWAKPVPADARHRQAARLSMRGYMPAAPMLLYLCHGIRNQSCCKQKTVLAWEVSEPI